MSVTASVHQPLTGFDRCNPCRLARSGKTLHASLTCFTGFLNPFWTGLPAKTCPVLGSGSLCVSPLTPSAASLHQESSKTSSAGNRFCRRKARSVQVTKTMLPKTVPFVLADSAKASPLRPSEASRVNGLWDLVPVARSTGLDPPRLRLSFPLRFSVAAHGFCGGKGQNPRRPPRSLPDSSLTVLQNFLAPVSGAFVKSTSAPLPYAAEISRTVRDERTAWGGERVYGVEPVGSLADMNRPIPKLFNEEEI